MSDYGRTYSYQYQIAPARKTVVRNEEAVGYACGESLDWPLDVQGAKYHRLFDEEYPSPDPVGLIETVDGEVFTYEDMIGRWDPKDAPLPSIEDVDAELARRAGRPSEIDEIIRKVDATESDFFARQLAEIDKSVYAAKYPVKRVTAIGPTSITLTAPGFWPDEPWYRRVVYAWRRLRARVGYFIAGHDPRDDGEDD